MGVTITGKYKGSPSYDMGYITFHRLRTDIAYAISKEFGDHYAEMPKACAKIIDVDSYNKRTEMLIKKYHCKERFLDFLYQNDTDGKLSPFKCKALLDGIQSIENDNLYGYTAYPAQCMTLKKFRELLSECFTRRCYLVWG